MHRASGTACLARRPTLEGCCLAFALNPNSAKQAARVVQPPGRLLFRPSFVRSPQEID